MMRIYVINLVRAIERRTKMAQQAENLGLTFDFIEATDGQSLTAEECARVDHNARKRISRFPLTRNEIGCWLSHLRAMQLLVDSGAPMATILEDDAALSPDFPRVLQAIETQAGSFDVIDLHRLFKKGEIFTPCRPLLPGFQLGRIGYTHMHATSYVMARRGAQKFLAHSQRFAHAIDKELHRYWINGLDIYGLEQPVARQDDGGHSYIDETRDQNRPDQRLPYPDADKACWRLQRRWSKLRDTVHKRLAFHCLRFRGKKY